MNDPCEVVHPRPKVNLFALERNVILAQLLQQTCINISPVRILSSEELFGLERVTQSRWIPVFIFDQGTLHGTVRPYLKIISDRFPGAKSIVIDEEFSVQLAFSLLRDRAHGFIQYRQLKRELPRAVCRVAKGHLWIHARLLEELCLHLQSIKALKSNGPVDLTPRQRAITDLVARHFSNKQIACELSISENTVKFHLAKVFSKLRINDRHSLADIALQAKGSDNRAPISQAMLLQ